MHHTPGGKPCITPVLVNIIACMQVRARLLADAEEREAQRLASEALEAMLKRLQRKMTQFGALEEALVREKAHAEVIQPFTQMEEIAHQQEDCAEIALMFSM